MRIDGFTAAAAASEGHKEHLFDNSHSITESPPMTAPPLFPPPVSYTHPFASTTPNTSSLPFPTTNSHINSHSNPFSSSLPTTSSHLFIDPETYPTPALPAPSPVPFQGKARLISGSSPFDTLPSSSIFPPTTTTVTQSVKTTVTSLPLSSSFSPFPPASPSHMNPPRPFSGIEGPSTSKNVTVTRPSTGPFDRPPGAPGVSVGVTSSMTSSGPSSVPSNTQTRSVSRGRMGLGDASAMFAVPENAFPSSTSTPRATAGGGAGGGGGRGKDAMALFSQSNTPDISPPTSCHTALPRHLEDMAAVLLTRRITSHHSLLPRLSLPLSLPRLHSLHHTQTLLVLSTLRVNLWRLHNSHSRLLQA